MGFGILYGIIGIKTRGVLMITKSWATAFFSFSGTAARSKQNNCQ
jgi:hypothetical protein